MSLTSPPIQAQVDEDLACCTSGDGLETCCGETCDATADSCTATCTENPLACLEQN